MRTLRVLKTIYAGEWEEAYLFGTDVVEATSWLFQAVQTRMHGHFVRPSEKNCLSILISAFAFVRHASCILPAYVCSSLEICVSDECRTKSSEILGDAVMRGRLPNASVLIKFEMDPGAVELDVSRILHVELQDQYQGTQCRYTRE